MPGKEKGFSFADQNKGLLAFRTLPVSKPGGIEPGFDLAVFERIGVGYAKAGKGAERNSSRGAASSKEEGKVSTALRRARLLPVPPVFHRDQDGPKRETCGQEDNHRAREAHAPMAARPSRRRRFTFP